MEGLAVLANILLFAGTAQANSVSFAKTVPANSFAKMGHMGNNIIMLSIYQIHWDENFFKNVGCWFLTEANKWQGNIFVVNSSTG